MKTEISEQVKKENKSVRNFMIDMIIILLVMSVVSIYTYGVRALSIILLTLLATVLTECIAYPVFLHRVPERIFDLSTVFTALVIALAVPSSSPLFMAPMGGIFAILIAKIPFGHTKTAPFIPAAVGISFLSVSYPQYMFTYPSLNIGSLSVSSDSAEFVAGDSLAAMLENSKSIGMTILNIFDVIVGRVPGPMGATCFIVMIGALIYMAIRKHPGIITAASYIAVCSLMAVIFPRVLTGRTYSLLMELSAGMLLYAAIFFISDPFTSPKNQLAKVLYGGAAGLLTMLFRYFGHVESSVCFVVLIMNALSTLFEVWGQKLDDKIQKINLEKKNRPKKEKPKKIKKEPSQDTSSTGGILDD